MWQVHIAHSFKMGPKNAIFLLFGPDYLTIIKLNKIKKILKSYQNIVATISDLIW